MLNKTDQPLYVRMSQLMLGIIAFFYIIYIGQGIIIPLLFSLIIAILLNPLVKLLERKLHRVVSISIAVVLAFVVTVGVMVFIGSQATMFSDSWPQLKLKFTEIFSDGVQWISENYNLSPEQIRQWVIKTRQEEFSNSSGMIGETLSSLSSFLVIIFLIPVYIFFFLFYKPLLLSFIEKLFSKVKHETVDEILNETKSLIQNYLVGLLIEFVLVSALNTIALLILGIEYALLIGVIGGLLNIIPYIGGIIAIAIPMILAFATREPIYALYVLGAYTLVQLIDNNFINPMVVASKVKINALVSIIVVIVGGALCGVAGMFLSLPITAIIKVLFDRIEPLKPFGYLLGDTMPSITKKITQIKKPKNEV